MQTKLSALKFAVFDVETTGLEPNSGDRIVEIAAVKAEGERIIDRFHSLINPDVPISHAAFEVNGISSEMLKNAPKPDKIIPKFMDFVKRNVLFAYNANFDAGFLKQELELLNLGLPPDLLIIDMLSMARALVSGLERYSLSSIAEHFGLLEHQKHRALEDSEMSFKVLERLFGILKTKGLDDFSYLKNVFCIDKELTNKLISERIAEIQEALSLEVKLKIKYFSSLRKELTEREVTPKEIIKENNKDYLMGYCHLRRKDRIFRIDGILQLEIV